HLSPAGHAGLDDVALAVERNLPRQSAYELGPLRPRADETHVPDDHIPELRQFVETSPAQQTPDARDASVARLRPDRSGTRLRVLAHRSNFVDVEQAAVLSDALLPIQRRTLGTRLHEDREH